ncbi:MAG: viroplasmin family protein [Fermentimonas sp.]
MAKNKKYYVVWSGKNPGIYDNWNDCKDNVMGYEKAVYKSFASFEEAKDAFNDSPYYYINSSKSKKQGKKLTNYKIVGIAQKSIAVDAACSGNPGLMEYRGVDTYTGQELFRQGPFTDGTNNIGEFLAIVHALAILKNNNEGYTIYSDSKTAIKWVEKKKCNTKLAKTYRNERIFELIARAEYWLKSNTYDIKIVKWNTSEWGEIPADFGRK